LRFSIAEFQCVFFSRISLFFIYCIIILNLFSSLFLFSLNWFRYLFMSLFLLVILINQLYDRVSQYYLSHDCSLLFKSSESLSLKSWLAAMPVVSRKVLEMLHSTFYEYSTLFLLCSSGKVIGSCQGEQGHQPLYSSLSKLLAVLHFSADPCQILSLSTSTSSGFLPSRHCHLLSQGSLNCDSSLFSNF
jgi:hypothetical protein